MPSPNTTCKYELSMQGSSGPTRCALARTERCAQAKNFAHFACGVLCGGLSTRSLTCE